MGYALGTSWGPVFNAIFRGHFECLSGGPLGEIFGPSLGPTLKPPGGLYWGCFSGTYLGSFLVEFYILIKILFVPLTKKNNLLEFCRLYKWVSLMNWYVPICHVEKTGFNLIGKFRLREYGHWMNGWLSAPDRPNFLQYISIDPPYWTFCKGSIQYFFKVSSMQFPTGFLRFYNSTFVLVV